MVLKSQPSIDNNVHVSSIWSEIGYDSTHIVIMKIEITGSQSYPSTKCMITLHYRLIINDGSQSYQTNVISSVEQSS